jgi:hypothetical protein
MVYTISGYNETLLNAASGELIKQKLHINAILLKRKSEEMLYVPGAIRE